MLGILKCFVLSPSIIVRTQLCYVIMCIRKVNWLNTITLQAGSEPLMIRLVWARVQENLLETDSNILTVFGMNSSNVHVHVHCVVCNHLIESHLFLQVH